MQTSTASLISTLPALISNQTAAVFLAEPIADALAAMTTLTLFFLQYRKQLFCRRKI
ncbi:MAG: hypothetical protein ACI3XY_07315 [Butyricicoccaceae bacterium]